MNGLRSVAAAVLALSAGVAVVVSPAQAATPSAGVEGIDVGATQVSVDWSSWWDQGKRFAGIKATEGSGYSNPAFVQQRTGAADAGLLVSASHFARPDVSGGAAQADYFVDHGGAWSADGTTLPGTLDLEWNPYGASCYGLSQVTMTAWVKAFGDRYHARTGRWPVIYTATSWWSQCTGNLADFSATDPLWVSSYTAPPMNLPYHWTTYTFWQYGDSGTAGVGLDQFNGSYDQLEALAAR